MYKKIKYSDQYLAKTLFKQALLFILILITILFLPWYVAIVKTGITSQFTWWNLSPILITLMIVGVFGWLLNWLYRSYALEHDNLIANYLRSIELRQLISLLIVSKGFYDTDRDEKGEFVSYFPKIRIKFLFKTGQIVLEEPVDGQKYMERFSKGEFDNTVEIALLADKQTTEFERNKMISTFAFEPIKFRRHLLELAPKKGVLQISKGIYWKYDTFVTTAQ